MKQERGAGWARPCLIFLDRDQRCPSPRSQATDDVPKRSSPGLENETKQAKSRATRGENSSCCEGRREKCSLLHPGSQQQGNRHPHHDQDDVVRMPGFFPPVAGLSPQTRRLKVPARALGSAFFRTGFLHHQAHIVLKGHLDAVQAFERHLFDLLLAMIHVKDPLWRVAEEPHPLTSKLRADGVELVLHTHTAIRTDLARERLSSEHIEPRVRVDLLRHGRQLRQGREGDPGWSLGAGTSLMWAFSMVMHQERAR